MTHEMTNRTETGFRSSGRGRGGATFRVLILSAAAGAMMFAAAGCERRTDTQGTQTDRIEREAETQPQTPPRRDDEPNRRVDEPGGS